MKIVMACGVFDLLHIGHLAHLEEARSLGHQLWVALTLDEFVEKGKGRPVFPWDERARMLRALRCVTRVVPNEHPVQSLYAYKPNIYTKGIEYAHVNIPEKPVCERMNIKLVFLNTDPVYHSSHILSGGLLRDRIGAS